MSEHISDIEAEETRDERAGRMATRIAIAGFTLMFVAATVMWIHFGPLIFMDLVTAVANCF
ncbi:hypothetical protein PY365_09785 [Roseiarcaceae bacterium H3SJ34-1]|uniref:hypothetical protein n=1 Tax=Terripilifer ovatus TaxID=3032367 RepID=UPI003AB98B8F|nr:hypothetical protein [Roseiarcaceae bacterium H3SJ34-1]